MNIGQRQKTLAVDALAAERPGITPAGDSHSAYGDTGRDADRNREDAKVRDCVKGAF